MITVSPTSPFVGETHGWSDGRPRPSALAPFARRDHHHAVFADSQRPPNHDGFQPTTDALALLSHTCPIPPSTLISTPVTYDDSGPARNSTVSATSSGLPNRFIGTFETR